MAKIWPFSLKNQVFGHFLRIRASDLSKTWSETGDNCFESSNDSVFFWENSCFGRFGHFWVKNTLHVVTFIWFWAAFGHFLLNC